MSILSLIGFAAYGLFGFYLIAAAVMYTFGMIGLTGRLCLKELLFVVALFGLGCYVIALAIQDAPFKIEMVSAEAGKAEGS